jgi:phospholipase C
VPVKRVRCAALLLFFALAACNRNASVGGLPTTLTPASGSSSKIQHVVIIFQENRSTDNLFHGFPGADTVGSGPNAQGKQIALAPVSLTAPYDLSHSHAGFVTEYASGKLDGFSKERSTCQGAIVCPPTTIRAYGYVPRDEVRPYFTMASSYAFADHMFQTNQGPSFPAHQYILSGTSTVANGSPLRAAENPFHPNSGPAGGCDSPTGSLVSLIDSAGHESQKTYPCFDRISLIELLDRSSLTWRYYQATSGPGLWNGPDAILHVRESGKFSSNVITPPSQVLTDIANGELADVVWVTPTALASDHALATNGSGPSWVAAVVNAIGESLYWSDTAIFVTWDDWGGWYDHVAPPLYNSYELSFRVPLIVISPYAKTHYVSHVQHEFGSILKFTEKIFGLPSLRTTDARADDLFDCFDFSQPPLKFKRIPAKYPPSYFLTQPSWEPDDS